MQIMKQMLAERETEKGREGGGSETLGEELEGLGGGRVSLKQKITPIRAINPRTEQIKLGRR
jgi:hypothetical protein